jgi:hypothetical protein
MKIELEYLQAQCKPGCDDSSPDFPAQSQKALVSAKIPGEFEALCSGFSKRRHEPPDLEIAA